MKRVHTHPWDGTSPCNERILSSAPGVREDGAGRTLGDPGKTGPAPCRPCSCLPQTGRNTQNVVGTEGGVFQKPSGEKSGPKEASMGRAACPREGSCVQDQSVSWRPQSRPHGHQGPLAGPVPLATSLSHLPLTFQQFQHLATKVHLPDGPGNTGQVPTFVSRPRGVWKMRLIS